MRERELVTRLVKINQSVRKLQSICIELTGFCDFDSGITGELAQAIDLLYDIVFEGISLERYEDNETINKFYNILWGGCFCRRKNRCFDKIGKSRLTIFRRLVKGKSVVITAMASNGTSKKNK